MPDIMSQTPHGKSDWSTKEEIHNSCWTPLPVSLINPLACILFFLNVLLMHVIKNAQWLLACLIL